MGIFGLRYQMSQVGLASWWVKPKATIRNWSERMISHDLELRHGPDSYGRQQWGILDKAKA